MSRLRTTFGAHRAFLVLDNSIRWRELSFEAIGLWAHIESAPADVVDIPALQAVFSDYDIGALVAELLGAGALFDADIPQPPLEEDMNCGVGTNKELPQHVPGFVYVIESSGHFKIGITKNLNSRLKQLQTGHYKSLEFIWHRRVANPAALELRLHNILQPLRASGEWFACTRQQLDDALSLGTLGHDEVAL